MMIEDRKTPFWRTPMGIAMLAVTAMVLVWHGFATSSFVIHALPLLFPLILCAVMHGVMHRGHGHGAQSPAPRKTD